VKRWGRMYISDEHFQTYSGIIVPADPWICLIRIR